MTQDGAWGHSRGLSTQRIAQHGEGEGGRQKCRELVTARCSRTQRRVALVEEVGDRAGGTEVH